MPEGKPFSPLLRGSTGRRWSAWSDTDLTRARSSGRWRWPFAAISIGAVTDMTRRQRLTLIGAILGSAVVMIDGSVVNVALPAIEQDLGGGLSAQQWLVNAYLLALASLILIGGSLGDIYGERRVFELGLVAFGVFSVACAIAPSIELLVGARALQGAAGALVTPSSLAIIVAAFGPAERGAAIGSWTAWEVSRRSWGRLPEG